MSDRKKVSLLFIGTELTKGTIQETHGRYMAPKLNDLGLDVKKIILLPDEMEISEDVKRETDQSDIVILTGGLGPTSDDFTREVVAEVCGCPLEFNEDLWNSIVSRYDHLSGSANRNQAYVPEGFSVIPNDRGTAPGLKGVVGSALVFLLPGPPREMRGMFDNYVFPLLEKDYGKYKEGILEVSCFLVCESGLEEACRDISSGKVTWGTRAQERRISLYVKGGEEQDRLSFVRSLKGYFGEERIRMGDIDLPEYVSSLLKDAGVRIASAESCTGGLFGKLITDYPGSSDVYTGGVIAYANDVKRGYLEVSEDILNRSGAVSRETAIEMASSVRDSTGSDIGISFTGIAGPGGGTSENPVGTVWIGISSGKSGDWAKRFNFTGSRERIRLKAVLTGFLLLEMSIKGENSLDTRGMWQYS